MSSTALSRCSVSVKIKHASGGNDWWLTSVYGPVVNTEKPVVLEELCQFQLTHAGPWLVAGDFNLIYQAADKNNDRLNKRPMGQFHHFLNDSVLKEIHLTGQLFT
jgi:hypothetical protein